MDRALNDSITEGRDIAGHRAAVVGGEVAVDDHIDRHLLIAGEVAVDDGQIPGLGFAGLHRIAVVVRGGGEEGQRSVLVAVAVTALETEHGLHRDRPISGGAADRGEGHGVGSGIAAHLVLRCRGGGDGSGTPFGFTEGRQRHRHTRIGGCASLCRALAGGQRGTGVAHDRGQGQGEKGQYQHHHQHRNQGRALVVASQSHQHDSGLPAPKAVAVAAPAMGTVTEPEANRNE